MLVECVRSDVASVDADSDLGRAISDFFGTAAPHLDLTVGGLYVVQLERLLPRIEELGERED
jgi:hypothetical protein